MMDYHTYLCDTCGNLTQVNTTNRNYAVHSICAGRATFDEFGALVGLGHDPQQMRQIGSRPLALTMPVRPR